MGILSGKRGLVIGVSNKWSIGSQIARECVKQGADTFITWHSDRSMDYVEGFKKDLNIIDPMVDAGCFQLDVTNSDIHETIKNGIRYDDFGGLDFVVHSVARAPKECFQQSFSNTSLEQWNETMKTSVWSFVNLVNVVLPLMNSNGSILTVSYIGGRKIIKGYNIMGIAKAALDASVRELSYEIGQKYNVRINAISPGPIKTLSSAKLGIPNKTDVLAPLKRKITLNDISKASTFLLSDLSSGITGTILDVDCGLNIIAAQ